MSTDDCPGSQPANTAAEAHCALEALYRDPNLTADETVDALNALLTSATAMRDQIESDPLFDRWSTPAAA